MWLAIFLKLWFPAVFAAANSPTLPPSDLLGSGISLKLAELRSKQISEVHYDLTFNIPASLAQPLTGENLIRFRLKSNNASVALDVYVTGNKPVVLKNISVNRNSAELIVDENHLVIPPGLLKSGENSIAIQFQLGETGLVRRDEFLYSLFVPDHAAKVFPCFDQPDLKATFNLTLKIPRAWVAVSQGAVSSEIIKNEEKIVSFNRSKPTSTYLFAFAAGKFERITRKLGDRSFTLFHRETDHTTVDRNVDVIFDIHAKSLAWMEAYSDIAFPFEKLDLVLLPAFPFSGMEHPGSIFYRDRRLFLGESATLADLHSRAVTIAHEVSHLWFGDLVTMRWFDDVWLKEVFANLIADKIVGPMFPDLNQNILFFLSHYPPAYDVDRTPGTHPIQQPLGNLNNASSLYGPIIYHKAPIMMAQLEKIIGEDSFRNGIREYLARFKFANATWDDLISILGRHTKTDLRVWNDTWIKHSGRPTLSATVSDSEHATLTVQSQSPETGRMWPQSIELNLVSGKESNSVTVALDKDRNVAASSWPGRALSYLSPRAGNPAYGLFLIDDKSLLYFLAHLENISDDETRTAAWVNLSENVYEKKIKPSDFIELARRALPYEKEITTIDFVLDFVNYLYWSALTKTERKTLATPLETMLWTQVNVATNSALKKTSYFKTYQSIFTRPSAWENAYRVWNGTLKIKSVNFSEYDYLQLAQALMLRNPKKSQAIFNTQLGRIQDPERKEEFKFVANAILGSDHDRDLFFSFLLDVNHRKNEPWVLDSLHFLNHPWRGPRSEKYLAKSLAKLAEIKATGGIFFAQNWISNSLGFHATPTAIKTVNQFIISGAPVDPGLRQKLRQSLYYLQTFSQ